MSPDQLKELPDLVLLERLIMHVERSRGVSASMGFALTESAVVRLEETRKSSDLEIENCKAELLRRFDSLRGELRLLRHRGIG